jgi:N-acetylglucosaminyldiphosphoundecaprenol N-acetyl-beta-D-mannosaminyltransferase
LVDSAPARRLRTYWLLGLPFDCITLPQAAGLLSEAAERRTRLLFATPNVNFVAEASRDLEFRDAILRTDLALVDGMPLVWMGRLLGVPFPERVAGSALTELLARRTTGKPLRVFFFGGEIGAAEGAARTTATNAPGLEPVGFRFPQHGSARDLSTSVHLSAINSSNADFLIVALGAKKGHVWLDINWDHLNVPIASHLGAVINFLAGNIRRAPRWAQEAGMEWIWRIIEEPHLGKRYLRDGLTLARLAAKSVLGVRIALWWERLAGSACRVEFSQDADRRTAKVLGVALDSDVEKLDAALATSLSLGFRHVLFDFGSCSFLSPRAIGWIYSLMQDSQLARLTRVVGLDEAPFRSLKLQRADVLLTTGWLARRTRNIE